MDRNLSYWRQIAPFELSEADERSLTQTDDDYTHQTWEELKAAVDAGDLSQLTRSPSDMQKYLLWRLKMRSSYSDISEYVLRHRIGWALPTPSGHRVESEIPFAHPSDYRIRRNDWPYGLTPDIAHMVVWLKTPIEVDHVGDPTSASKTLIEAFVARVFRDRIAPDPTSTADRILWFKNRARMQSVRSLEHIHVMVRGVDQSLIEEWTGQTELDIVARSGFESPKDESSVHCAS